MTGHPADSRGAPAPEDVAALHANGDWLTVRWADGHESRFPAVWLRDNVPGGRHTAEGQRLFDIAALPADIAIAGAVLDGDGRVAVTFAPEDESAAFDPAWLRAHCLSETARTARRQEPLLWGRELADALPRGDYREVAGGGAPLARWLARVRDYGFALLDDVPVEPGMVCRVAELFGHVRETNYGRLFDVVSQAQPDNLAYTGMALGMHTDNPYREPVPGLQLLHCLESEAEGGESLVCDGFAAAERLRREAPEDFALLTRYPMPFRYAAPSVDLRAARPLIQLDTEGRVAGVCYNNRSAAPLDLPADVVPDFYRAYRRFAQLLHDPAALAGFRLAPGQLFIVDNQRVLHGRKGFTGGRRHLQGCYADKDGLMSTLRVLEAA